MKTYEDEYAEFLKHYQETLNKKSKYGNKVYYCVGWLLRLFCSEK